jgi:hypothetical protein
MTVFAALSHLGNPCTGFEDHQRIPTACYHDPHRAAIRQPHAFLG